MYKERGVYNFYLRKPGYQSSKETSGLELLGGETAELNASAESGRPDSDNPVEGEDVESEEIQPAVKLKAPEEPTPAEIEEHEATGHVQYRTWCRHCVAGRAIGQPHCTQSEEQSKEDRTDYRCGLHFYMVRGDGEEDRAKPILVAKDDRTQSVAATFVDAKGPRRTQ